MSGIDVREFKSIYDAGQTDWALLDIREKGEANDGHIFGATVLPRRLIEYRIAELVPDRNTRIFVCGGDDRRAALAVTTLSRLGYANVREILGGLPAWLDVAGGELSTGSNVPSKDFGEKIHVQEHVPSLTVEEFVKRRERGDDMVVCDVRTPEEFLTGHIPGAHSCPSFDIALKAFDLANDHATIIVNCAGRTRSIIGAGTLAKLGLKNVYALENGTSGWLLDERTLEKGEAAPVGAPSAASLEQAEQAAGRLASSVGVRHVDAAELKRMRAGRPGGNLYVFDVRPLKDYEQGHIDGAIAVPGGQAVQRTDDFVAVRDATIVLIDQREARAMTTGYWYRRMGLPNVFVLAGGIEGWREAGGDLVKGRSRSVPLGLKEAQAQVRKLEPRDVAARLADGRKCVVIDVGTSRQFAAGHLPGALWRPRNWLELVVGDIARPEDDIVVSAAEESQAVFAAAALKEFGYKNAVVVAGGTRGWTGAGLTLEKGESGDTFGGPDFVLPPYEQGREGMLRYLDWEIKLGRKYEHSGGGNAR